MANTSRSRTEDAKDAIEQFLRTGQAGVETSFSENTLTKAAQSLFTARGLDCPVQVFATGGKTYLINRNVNPS